MAVAGLEGADSIYCFSACSLTEVEGQGPAAGLGAALAAAQAVEVLGDLGAVEILAAAAQVAAGNRTATRLQ